MNKEKLEEEIIRQSRATRSSWGWTARVHEKMRLTFPWYQRWHSLRAANTIHVAGAITVGLMFGIVMVAMIGSISIFGLVKWVKMFIE